MKSFGKKLAPLLILLGLSATTLATTEQQFSAENIFVSKQDTIHTILFEISSPKSKQVSYLFGTHHAFGQYFFDSLSIAKQKLLSSDMLLKENIDIPGHSAAELHAFLSRHYRERVCGAKQPSDSFLTLDDYIEQLAAAQDLQLLGFETLEEQMKLINEDVKGMPAKVHKKRLARLVERLQNNNAEECGEVSWYRNMEINYELDRVCRNSLILTDRNNKWLLKMEPYLKTKNCFIAVGLSHLMFKCGLVNQLRESGYRVRPIPVK